MNIVEKHPIIYALLTGVLLGASFPQSISGAGIFVFIAWIPLLLALVNHGREASRWRLIGWFYVSFVVFHGISNWWVCSWQEKTDPYLFASGIALWLVHPFFLMLPFLALASIRRRLGATWMMVSAPLAIAGFEWLHGQSEASYPWLTTGYALVHTPFAQVADTVGVYGLSFMISIVNIVFLSIILGRRHGLPIWRAVSLLTTGIVLWLGIGIVKQNTWSKASTNTNIHVTVVQPNEDPWDKWADTREQVSTHRKIVDRSRNVHGSTDLIVWSETAIPYTIRDPRFSLEWQELKHWVDTTNVPLLTGYADVMVYALGEAPPSARQSRIDTSVRYDVFNAAMMINPGSENVSVHRKSMLTPFAERLPFADQLTFAMSWIEWGVGISSWGKGRLRQPLAVIQNGDTVANVGTIICIESIYPEVASDLVKNGADVLCVITNDAWYNGTWGPEQHFDIARMRAIEQRKFVIRCANSGVSGIIRLDGSSDPRAAIAPLTQGIAEGAVQRAPQRTLYAMVGDPLPIFGLFVTLFILVGARIPLILRNLPFRSTSSD